MKYGAKNQLSGKVTAIKRGTVMSQVDISVPARANMSSVMTLDTLKGMKLRKGDEVKVIVKAVNVLLVKE
ncbi:MAG: TOBE domain-containing protein [Gammaproteobacteria bacterium]